MKIKSLSTHNGQFHTDEVMAVALLSLFEITRTHYNYPDTGGLGR